MSRIGFYTVYLISFLPLSVLYGFARLLELLFNSVWPYRKNVIQNQIIKAFPDYTSKQVSQLIFRYYRHMSELIVESVKNLSMSKTSLRKRLHIENPEILNNLYSKGQSVVLVSAHYNNWEWLISALPSLIPHKVLGIGAPLRNSFWNKKLNMCRSRFGFHVVDSKSYKHYLQNCTSPCAVLMLSDQSPSNPDKAYWMHFLNQSTAIAFGPELISLEYSFVPVYAHINKIKRGYYSIKLISFNQNSVQPHYGDISAWHAGILQQGIIQNPQYWLWSHRRWKHKAPESITEWHMQQTEQFKKRFGRQKLD